MGHGDLLCVHLWFFSKDVLAVAVFSCDRKASKAAAKGNEKRAAKIATRTSNRLRKAEVRAVKKEKIKAIKASGGPKSAVKAVKKDTRNIVKQGNAATKNRISAINSKPKPSSKPAARKTDGSSKTGGKGVVKPAVMPRGSKPTPKPKGKPAPKGSLSQTNKGTRMGNKNTTKPKPSKPSGHNVPMKARKQQEAFKSRMPGKGAFKGKRKNER